MSGYGRIIHKLHEIQIETQDLIREATNFKGRGMDNSHTERLLNLRRQIDKDLTWFVIEEENSI